MEPLRKTLAHFHSDESFQFQEGFTAGREAGFRLAKGKADKLRDGQLEKALAAWQKAGNQSESAVRGFRRGFVRGWEAYRVFQVRKKTKKIKK